jgi:hypothetical protein
MYPTLNYQPAPTNSLHVNREFVVLPNGASFPCDTQYCHRSAEVFISSNGTTSGSLSTLFSVDSRMFSHDPVLAQILGLIKSLKYRAVPYSSVCPNFPQAGDPTDTVRVHDLGSDVGDLRGLLKRVYESRRVRQKFTIPMSPFWHL